ncbi:MAG: prepilin-type N-terminal cleavage/methylation domain-containing protein [Patescibacteria group bacterium]
MDKNGYTLLEILITISILAATFAAGYTGFREFSRRQAVNSVVNSVKSDLNLTQKQALDGKKPPTCDGGLINYAFQVTSSNTYTISAKCTNSVLIKSVTLPSGITINPTPSPNPIEFKTIGQGTNITASPASNYATFTILNSQINYSSQITIGSNGEVN